MSVASPEPSLAGISLSGTTLSPTSDAQSTHESSSSFQFPNYTKYPPFYTLQPNVTTRAKQLELWSALILAYCAHHRLFRLSLSSLPGELFGEASISRALRPSDVRTLLEYMSRAENGARVEWITAGSSGGGSSGARGEPSSTCYVHWRTPAEWADAIYAWVDGSGQKGGVLTVYELREGDAARGREWRDIDEAVLRKALNVLVRRGKAQVFGQEESAGVKFF